MMLVCLCGSGKCDEQVRDWTFMYSGYFPNVCILFDQFLLPVNPLAFHLHVKNIIPCGGILVMALSRMLMETGPT